MPRPDVIGVGGPPPLKPEHSPGLVVGDVVYRIQQADARHWHYISDALGKTLPQQDQTLSHGAAFLQGLLLLTSRPWFTYIATPDGDEILGFVIYGQCTSVAWVQVKAKYRGRGIGAALLNWPMQDKDWDKHTATPFASEDGWAWARRRGWTPHYRPNLLWKAMDALCKSMVIEELKGRLP